MMGGPAAAAAVLWITPKLPLPLVSGDKIRQYNLLRRLAARHTIDLVAFAERGDAHRFVPELERCCRRVRIVPLPSRRPAPVRALQALHPRAPFYAQRYRSGRLRRAIAEAAGEARYDVVQVEHVYMAPYLASAAAGGAARLLTLHNIESAAAARCAAIEPHLLKRWYWRAESRKLAGLERRWLARVDAVVTVSEADGAAARAIAPGARVLTVENGVDTEAYRVADDEARDRSILFTGSLRYAPNADAAAFLLDAVWPRIRRAVPGARCVIVGRDPGPRLLARHGEDGVAVTGPVDDVRPYLARAGAVVVPLRAGGGTRLKILEAMATGAGIVSTRIGAEGLAVRGGRELLLADDPEGFATAVVRVLGDRELRRRLGSAARRLAEARYDWRFAAEAQERAYAAAREGGERCAC